MTFRRLLAFLSSFVFSSLLANAEPLKVGDKAPDATALSHLGQKFNLAEAYRKSEYTLVYFFPKADTPGCTKQGCSLRDAYAELTKLKVSVIGVSIDSVEAQKAFLDKYHLPFVLLADTEHKVIDAFGVPRIPVAGFAKRQAFLIKGGTIVWADYSASTDKQAEDVIKVVRGN
jgi:peroxiredoxin Q/BCP